MAGVSVLLTTPYMDEASRCQRVGFMRSGKLIAEGSPAMLRAGLNGRIIEVRGESPISLRPLVEALSGVEDVRTFGDKLHVRVETGKARTVMAALEKALSHRKEGHLEARVVSPTLEDVFICVHRSCQMRIHPGSPRKTWPGTPNPPETHSAERIPVGSDRVWPDCAYRVWTWMSMTWTSRRMKAISG